MLFNKELNANISKYKKYIDTDKWFEYKKLKKIIKYISIRYPNIINNIKNNIYNYENEECCICLENNNLMKTFCCHKYIHHKCLVHTLSFSNSCCPLCREIINKMIICNLDDDKEEFDTKILSLISIIHINIIKIENYILYNKVTKNRIIREYKIVNYKAIIKMCKKIDKKLGLNIKSYFIEVINKNKFINEIIPSTHLLNIPTFLCCFTNSLSFS